MLSDDKNEDPVLVCFGTKHRVVSVVLAVFTSDIRGCEIRYLLYRGAASLALESAAIPLAFRLVV